MAKWKKSGVHSRPTTKIAWESDEKDYLEIDYIKSSNIPYKIIFNGEQVDSTGTYEKARKIAYMIRRNN